MRVEQIAMSAIDRYDAASASYPQFLLELERAVDAAEAARDTRAADFRRLWGELEIINALHQGEGLNPSDQTEVASIVGEIRSLLAS